MDIEELPSIDRRSAERLNHLQHILNLERDNLGARTARPPLPQGCRDAAYREEEKLYAAIRGSGPPSLEGSARGTSPPPFASWDQPRIPTSRLR